MVTLAPRLEYRSIDYGTYEIFIPVIVWNENSIVCKIGVYVGWKPNIVSRPKRGYKLTFIDR